MIDSIKIYNGTEPEIDSLPEVGEKAYNEINQINSPRGTTSYRKKHLLNGKVIVNYSQRHDRAGVCVSKNKFVNISSLAYLLEADTNLATVGPRSLEKAFRNLDRLLKSDGVTFDLYSAKISRLDLTLTLKVSSPIAFYFPLLRTLQPKGFEKHEHDGTSITFRKGNENSLIIYDKLRELESRHSLQPSRIRADYGINNDEYLLRIEHQYRRARQVQKHLGINTIRDLISKSHDLDLAIKEEVKGLFGNVTSKSIKGVKANLDDHLIHLEYINGQESLFYHFSILRSCNWNIQEAEQIICKYKGIDNQRFRHRTRDKLHAALDIHRQTMLQHEKDQYSEIIKCVRRPIWL